MSKPSESRVDSEGTAARARDVANRIEALPQTIKTLFVENAPGDERLRRTKRLATKLEVDMLPVFSYLERRKSLELARLWMARLHWVGHYAAALARTDIPEWAEHKPLDTRTDRARAAATFVAQAMTVAALMRDLASEIDAGRPRFGGKRSASQKRQIRQRVLTPRDNEVLEMLSDCGGVSNAAKKLGVTKQYVHSVKKKAAALLREKPTGRRVRGDQTLPDIDLSEGAGDADKGYARKLRVKYKA